jgi:glycosyltransferase involved in cell wall biosynthesis
LNVQNQVVFGIQRHRRGEGLENSSKAKMSQLATSLSVIIPAKNEARHLQLCLESLKLEKERYPWIKEIVVVDNESTDSTAEVAKSNSVDVYTVSGTVSAVRNVGVSKSSALNLCFIDADIEVAPGWSQAIHEHLLALGQRASLEVFGAIVVAPQSATWVEKSWYRFLASNQNPTYINSGNMILSRELFCRIGGFNPELSTSEDIDLCKRAVEAGASIQHNERIVAIHHGYPTSLRGIFVREYWHGLSIINHIRKGSIKRIDLLALFFLSLFISSVALLILAKPLWATGLLMFGPAVTYSSAASRTKLYFGLAALEIGSLVTVAVVARSLALIGAILKIKVQFGGGNRS